MLKFQFFKFWLNLVKPVRQMIKKYRALLNNYAIILVLLNKYLSFFQFWSNLVKLWSNNGQTNYSRNISVTK